MTTWRHIVVEAFCMAPYDSPPCGKRHVSPYCLGHGQAKCPWLGHSTSSAECDAALYVPLRYVLWDRAASWLREAWWLCHWHLWERWQYVPGENVTHCVNTDAHDALAAALERRNRETDAVFGAWLARQREGEKEAR